MSEFTIHHADGRGFVTITRGSQRYLTTPMAAGLALMGLVGEDAATSTEVEWDDHLATHGIAIGRVGQETITLAVRPVMVRQVNQSNVATPRTLTYPPTLTCLVTSRQGSAGRAAVTRFVRGMFYCLKPAALGTLSVTGLNPVAAPFPYGNVYAEGRICWGGVATAGSGRTIAELEALFYGSGFNGDLYHPAAFVSPASGAAFSTMMSAPGGVLPALRDAAFTVNLPTIITRLRRD